MKPMLVAPICLTALLAACADMGADVDPILDGAPRAQFQSDLAACRSLVRSQSQLDHDTMAAAAIGAAIGGVLVRSTKRVTPWAGPSSARWRAPRRARPRQATRARTSS